MQRPDDATRSWQSAARSRPGLPIVDYKALPPLAYFVTWPRGLVVASSAITRVHRNQDLLVDKS